MRTLKKTLCLVLALAMVLSLGVISASATDFSDIDQSKHEVAVKVLNAIGIVEGYNYTDQVRPNEPLTRAQAAKIATLLLGVDAENQSLPTVFSDVPNSHWAKSFIAYCAGEGILNGDSGIGGNFRPEANVTGVEFAKIMLGVLGYNAKEEGLSYSESWAVTTTSLAMRTGVLVDLGDLDFNAAVTRDQAFQMAFNALTANVVRYQFSASAGDITITSPARAGYYTTNDYCGNGDNITQLCELNFPDLTLSKVGLDKTDDFGRPGATWKNGSTAIAFAPEDVYAKYDGTFTGNDVKNLGKNITDSSVCLYYNGQKWNLSDVVFKANKDAAGASSVWHDDKTGVCGFEVEIYKHVHDADDCYNAGGALTCSLSYDVVVIEPWAAVITDVAKDGTVSLAILDGGTAYDTTISTTPFATIGKDDDLYSLVEKCEEGDLLAAYWARGQAGPGERLVDLVPLKEETVTISRIDGEGTAKQNYLSTVTADDGTVYKFVKSAVWTDGDDFYNPGFKGATDAEVKIHLGDATLYTLNGKVMVVNQTPASNTGFAYVLDYKQDAGNGNTNWTDDPNGSDPVYYARLQLADNSIIEVVVDKDAVNKQSRLVYYEAANVNGVETYSLYNVNGNNAELQAAGYTGRTGTSSDFKITPNVAAGVGSSPNLSDLIYDSKTLFFVATAGVGNKNDSVTVYKGIANVPALDGTADIRVAYDTTGKHVAAIQVLYAAGGMDKDTYFIAGYSGATEVTEMIGDTEYTYYEYKAVVNGEIIDVKVSKSVSGSDGVMFVDSVTYTDGIITDVGDTVDSAGQTGNNGSETITKVKNNTVSDKNSKEWYINDATVIYEYDSAGNIEEIDFSDVADSTTGWIIPTSATNEVIKTLYVAKD